MTEERKDCWDIVSKAIIRERVAFGEPVTEEEAKHRYDIGDFDDVIDFEVIEIKEVKWAT